MIEWRTIRRQQAFDPLRAKGRPYSLASPTRFSHAAWQLCSCEGLFVSLHGVEDGEKLSGDGDDCDF
ncbi:hypothetical protein, partial [Fulvimarina manganoxydans]|uniref:hypothetical protein n=1 Tax=Fulvimarina manganoxydans TaxID=937218 RepID=UPI001AEC7FFB